MVDQQKFLDITARVMQDATLLPVEIDIMSAWLLISGLQLTVRHPGISEHMKTALTRIARVFQARVVEAHPEAEELIEMGWNAVFDVDEDGFTGVPLEWVAPDEDGDYDDGGLDWDEPGDDEDSLDYWVSRCSLVGDDCLSAGSEDCDRCPFNPLYHGDDDDEYEPWDDGDDAA